MQRSARRQQWEWEDEHPNRQKYIDRVYNGVFENARTAKHKSHGDTAAGKDR